MSLLRWRDNLFLPKAGADLTHPEHPIMSSRWWFWLVLGLALFFRLIWLDLSQNFIGADAIRYLWISQHVSQGNWQLLPQLYTSPLLPALVGLLARLTHDPLLAGRALCILANVTAVGLAMLLVRQFFPQRPILAWLTGLGLAVNHVWCSMAPFVLTDNLFYPLLIGLLLLMALLLEKVTISRSLGFGLVWGLLFLSREIGLYCGIVVFVCLAAALYRTRLVSKAAAPAFWRFNVASAAMLAFVLLLWGAWYYHSLGIISLGEGRRFYTSYTQKFERKSRHPSYENQNGTLSFFHLRPYEVMEFTRFPAPGDERYPPSGAFTLFHQPFLTLATVWDNLLWTSREFQRTTLVGFLTLFIGIPLGILWRRAALPEKVYWVFGASLGVLGLHFLGPVREARLVGWFFPWLYLGLAGFTLWLWHLVESRPWRSSIKKGLTALIGGLFIFHLLYPQYFKEVPRRWPLRQASQVHIMAGEKILPSFGVGAVVASREPEVAYPSQGFWIGLPYGTPEEIVAWLYLGGADYMLLHDVMPIPDEEKIFWSDLQELHKQIPELEVVAEFNLPKPSAYGKHGRLFRFRPRKERLALNKKQFPWAGTHPRVTGASVPGIPNPNGETNRHEN
jgi:hypothetical protein